MRPLNAFQTQKELHMEVATRKAKYARKMAKKLAAATGKAMPVRKLEKRSSTKTRNVSTPVGLLKFGCG